MQPLNDAPPRVRRVRSHLVHELGWLMNRNGCRKIIGHHMQHVQKNYLNTQAVITAPEIIGQSDKILFADLSAI